MRTGRRAEVHYVAKRLWPQFVFTPDCAMMRAVRAASLRRNSAKAAGVLPISS